MFKKVLAAITTYNPDIALLKANIDAVKNQVDKLIVYENASVNRAEIVALCENQGVEIILNDKNYGVAGPLHDGIEYANTNNYDFILTLDQDSVCSQCMVDKLVALMESDGQLAIVAAQPACEDSVSLPKSYSENQYVDLVITSGALTDVKKIVAIGNYIPEMFIDCVDTEICCRCRKNNYKIMQSNVPMQHCFGEPIKRRFLWKTYIAPSYSALRYYYIFRNAYVCHLIYSKNKKFIKANKHWLCVFKLKILLYEKNKREKLRATRRGKKDAKAFYNKVCEAHEFLREI